MGKAPSRMELHLLSPIEWVKREREKQDKQWGRQNHNCLRWLGIFMEEVGEVAKEVEQANYGVSSRKGWLTALEYELIQVAAVCVSWIEAIRREKGSEKLPVCACESCTWRAANGKSNQDG